MNEETSNRVEVLLAEYAAAQTDYLHNDAFAWNIGSILIAGAFVFWGLLAGKESSLEILIIGILLVSLLMSTWLLYYHLYRQIWLFKLSRMWEIENELGMSVHLGWVKNDSNGPKYTTHGPRGYLMIIFIYILVTLTGPGIGCVKYGPQWPLLLPVLIVVVVLSLIMRNERKIQERLTIIKEEVAMEGPLKTK